MTGNRLPGDDGSAKRQKKQLRAEVRLDGQLADRFETTRQQKDLTKAALVREALDEYLPGDDVEYLTPADPDLAAAYLRLARHEKRVLSVGRAVDLLAKTACSQIPKEHIRTEILSQLSRAGFTGIKAGNIAVEPLCPVEEVPEEVNL
jgi:predicted DNA-binding protein